MKAVDDSRPSRDLGIPSWLEVATSAPVVRRALLYFVLVGSVLIAINHGDALLRGDVDGVRLFKMFLTPVVPYVVSTLSSVSAIRAHAAERIRDASAEGRASGGVGG